MTISSFRLQGTPLLDSAKPDKYRSELPERRGRTGTHTEQQLRKSRMPS